MCGASWVSCRACFSDVHTFQSGPGVLLVSGAACFHLFANLFSAGWSPILTDAVFLSALWLKDGDLMGTHAQNP